MTRTRAADTVRWLILLVLFDASLFTHSFYASPNAVKQIVSRLQVIQRMVEFHRRNRKAVTCSTVPCRTAVCVRFS